MNIPMGRPQDHQQEREQYWHYCAWCKEKGYIPKSMGAWLARRYDRALGKLVDVATR